jgi:hypothetical protein
MNDELARIRELAQEKLDALQEPPWATGRYQHLIALIDEIEASQAQPVRYRPRGNNIVQFANARRRPALASRRLPR